MRRPRNIAAGLLGLLAPAGLLLLLGPALIAGGDDDRIVHKHRYVFQSGKGAYLGVHIEEATDSEEGGALVMRVVEKFDAIA